MATTASRFELDLPGRNEPCWCGSGNKYKKCHLDREHQTRLPLSEVFRQAKRVFSRKVCLHPAASKAACSSAIIQAHTLARSGVLDRIAHHGHVYTFEQELARILGRSNRDPRLIGVSRASTFPGFCSLHDGQLFAPLENADFCQSDEQIFLLMYRAVAMELHKKTGLSSHAYRELMRQLDRGRSLEHQRRVQLLGDGLVEGARHAVVHLRRLKGVLDKAYLNKDWSCLAWAFLEFKDTPDIVSSGVFNPEQDLSGSSIQRMEALVADSRYQDIEGVCLSIIPTRQGTGVVLAWPRNESAGRLLVESLFLQKDEALGSAIVQLAFEYVENTYASPTWWEGLAAPLKGDLLNRMVQTTLGDRVSSALVPDGHSYVSWRMVNKRVHI